MRSVLAFDFGASTCRAIKAVYENGKIEYSEIHRFDNTPLIENGGVHHNTEMIISEVKKAIQAAGEIDSLAFDTWGVDYVLLDENGKLLGEPFHYRDLRTQNALEKAEKVMPLSEIYSKTGNQIMSINTLFQLLSDEKVKEADKLLFMPDYFSFLLCKNAVCEMTIASTSQMMSPKTHSFNDDILKCFGIKSSLFAPLTESATVIGEYNGIKVVSVAGHDTQCAVAAMPSQNPNAAFLSCGTWSLIGCELDEPVMSEESFLLELSNEIGANGKVNFLKNISGLWLIQETKRNLAEQGESYTYNELEQLARAAEPFKCFIDPDAPELSAHGSLPDKIRTFCKKTGQSVPESVGEIVRCIYESLALKYKMALEQIESCTKKHFEALNILGGGTKDGFLCQMTSDSTGLPVIAGPTEATALGNIVLQLIALGELSDVESGRKLISESETLKNYHPEGSLPWDEAYSRFKKLF